MPTRPYPGPGGGTAVPPPPPSSSTPMMISSSRYSTVTVHEPAPACRTTLVTDSCTTRNADRSMSAGSGLRSPRHRTSTRTPAAVVVAARRSTSASPAAGSNGTASRPAPGPRLRDTPPVSLSRRAPSSRRSPASVSRPAVSTAIIASRALAGWVSATRAAAPACNAMMPMLCATVSCISRAIRSRSAVMACAVAWARSRSVYARVRRTESPSSQATATSRQYVCQSDQLLSMEWGRRKGSPSTCRRSAKPGRAQSARVKAAARARAPRVATTKPRAMSTPAYCKKVMPTSPSASVVVYEQPISSVSAVRGRRRSRRPAQSAAPRAAAMSAQSHGAGPGRPLVGIRGRPKCARAATAVPRHQAAAAHAPGDAYAVRGWGGDADMR
ncbi:hypothetical protein SALBM135S_07603 [Streptomyces alboniger]